MARPSKYTPKIGDKICELIAESDRGLTHICKADDMPSSRTVYRWLNDNESFCQQYARARERQAEFLAEQILKIADTPQIGTKRVKKPTGVEITQGDMIEHRKLQIEARKWVASHLAPKKFGNHVDVTSDGAPINSGTVINLEGIGMQIKA